MNKDLYNGSIFIYSNFCPHSQKLYNILKQNNTVNKYRLVCIDIDQKTKKRPMQFYEIQKLLNINITSVPTIIVDNAKYVLSGSEAFKYVSHINSSNSNSNNKPSVQQVVAQREPEGPMAFNPNEMGSTSDSYLNFGNIENYHSADVPKQNYQFLNEDFTIETPDEANFNINMKDDIYHKKMNERESFDKIVQSENSLKQRNVNTEKKNTKSNQKQVEFEDKYNKLLKERETMESKPTSRPKINFQTGQVQY